MPDVLDEHQFIMLESFETIYFSTNRTVPFMSQSFIAGLAILCHFMPNYRSLWASSLIPSIQTRKILCGLKLALYTCPEIHMRCFCIETYILRRHIPNGPILLQLLEFPCLCGTIEPCRFSVGCLKQNGALQHLKIKLMMDVYQTVLANASQNYNIFWVILTLSKSRKID